MNDSDTQKMMTYMSAVNNLHELKRFVQSLVDDMPEPPPEDWDMDGKNEAIEASEDLTRISIGERAKMVLDGLE